MDIRLERIKNAVTYLAIGDYSAADALETSDKSDKIDALILAVKNYAQKARAFSPYNPHFRHLFDEHPDMVMLLDNSGNIEMVNAQACSGLGYSIAELLRRKFSGLLAPYRDGVVIERDHFLPPAEGELQLFETIYNRHGKAIEVAIRIKGFVGSGGTSFYLVTITDISLPKLQKQLMAWSLAVGDPRHRSYLQEAARCLTEKITVNPAIDEFRLTERELDIMTCMSKGMEAKEMAELFGSSLRTVEGQRNRLYDKLGVEKDTALIQKANDMGLIGIRSWGVLPRKPGVSPTDIASRMVAA